MRIISFRTDKPTHGFRDKRFADSNNFIPTYTHYIY